MLGDWLGDWLGDRLGLVVGEGVKLFLQAFVPLLKSVSVVVITMSDDAKKITFFHRNELAYQSPSAMSPNLCSNGSQYIHTLKNEVVRCRETRSNSYLNSDNMHTWHCNYYCQYSPTFCSKHITRCNYHQQ